MSQQIRHLQNAHNRCSQCRVVHGAEELRKVQQHAKKAASNQHQGECQRSNLPTPSLYAGADLLGFSSE